MEREKKKSIIEAVLFIIGDTVEISKLAHLVEEDIKQINEIIAEMEQEYVQNKRGIRLLKLDKSVQLCTDPELFDYIIQIANAPKKVALTETMLETLSIIAYKQPVTRMEIEKVRGVSCDFAVNRLLEYELIKELGRLDAPGRPLLFGTTEQFLRSFGVNALDDLPEISADQLAEFKIQAEQEIHVQLDV